MSGSTLHAALQQAYLEACECELNAFKPGNVSVYSAGHDMTVEDFRRSARVSVQALCDPSLSLGEKIYRAVAETRQIVGCNTNLGIVLLCAPLLQSAEFAAQAGSLLQGIQHTLSTTTQQDAAWAYKAIRLANPGGLGQSRQQDVHETPQVTLTEAMRIASSRDHIAYQYSNQYSSVLKIAATTYHRSLAQWGDQCWAAVAVFLDLLRQFPDSHIERKFGNRYTTEVATKAALLYEELIGTDRPESIMRSLQEADAGFKSAGINPGTTADLTVACLLTVRLETLLSR